MTFPSIYEHIGFPRMQSHRNSRVALNRIIRRAFSPKLEVTCASNCEDMSKQTFRLISWFSYVSFLRCFDLAIKDIRTKKLNTTVVTIIMIIEWTDTSNAYHQTFRPKRYKNLSAVIKCQQKRLLPFYIFVCSAIFSAGSWWSSSHRWPLALPGTFPKKKTVIPWNKIGRP